MKYLRATICTACLLGMALPAAAGTLAGPKSEGLGKPTPPALPVTPFFQQLYQSTSAPAAFGPANGSLGISNFTISNYSKLSQLVSLVNITTAGGRALSQTGRVAQRTMYLSGRRLA
jgi:VIT1/CCC1 family predicted Fe2+/Mn2+ transporter